MGPPPGQLLHRPPKASARPAQRPGRPPGVQARGHLRGRSSPPTRLHVLDLRGTSARSATDRQKKIMVLGGGPNRIGQGIEFDYCCVRAALAMREDGYETIMVNCNPETVHRLRHLRPPVLRAADARDVLEIVDKEKPTA